MKHNVGKTDKNIRIVGGLVIIALGLMLKSWWGLIGFLPLITGLLSFCPLYLLLKISTVKEEKKK